MVFDATGESVLREVCLEIGLRYEIEFVEIGTDADRVHFLVQSVPTYSPTKIITLLKSLVAREVFKRCPHVKKKLWGGEFWSDGYFVSTVGPQGAGRRAQGNEQTIANYVREQGQEQGTDLAYQQLYRTQPTVQPLCSDQLTLF